MRDQFEDLWAAAHSDFASPQHAADAWGRLGLWFHVYQYPDSATSSYANALNTQPDRAQWLYYSALLDESLGRTESARISFERAYELDKRSELAYRLGMLALGSRQLETARRYFKEALDTTPDFVPAFTGLGQLEIESDAPRRAIDFLQKASALQPSASRIHYLLGQAYRMADDLDNATYHLDQVPEDTTSHVAIAHNDEWVSEMNRMDVSSRTLARRARNAFVDKRFPEALRLSELAAAADPDEVETMVNHALALAAVGQPLKARDRYREALDLDENHVRANFLLGALLADNRQFLQSITYLRKAVELNPRFAAAQSRLASSLMQIGDFDNAALHYGVASRLDPENADLRFWLTVALLLSGESDASAAAIRGASDDNAVSPSLQLLAQRLQVAIPPTPRTFLNTAMGLETQALLAAQQGQFDKAILLQEQAIRTIERLGRRTGANIARRRLALYSESRADVAVWEPREVPILKEFAEP